MQFKPSKVLTILGFPGLARVHLGARDLLVCSHSTPTRPAIPEKMLEFIEKQNQSDLFPTEISLFRCRCSRPLFIQVSLSVSLCLCLPRPRSPHKLIRPPQAASAATTTCHRPSHTGSNFPNFPRLFWPFDHDGIRWEFVDSSWAAF